MDSVNCPKFVVLWNSKKIVTEHLICAQYCARHCKGTHKLDPILALKNLLIHQTWE